MNEVEVNGNDVLYIGADVHERETQLAIFESGGVSFTGHITRDGNKFLRRNLVECARAAVRKDSHLKEFYLKLKHKRGERKALIAVARKMVSYAFWMLKRNQTYEELSPWDGS
jgi:transposase